MVSNQFRHGVSTSLRAKSKVKVITPRTTSRNVCALYYTALLPDSILFPESKFLAVYLSNTPEIRCDPARFFGIYERSGRMWTQFEKIFHFYFK